MKADWRVWKSACGIVSAALAAIGSLARADTPAPFAEIAGGYAVPVADHTWVRAIADSPALLVRGGVMWPMAGASLALSWTPLNVGPQYLNTASDQTGQRFRVVIRGSLHYPLSGFGDVEAYAGVGADILHDAFDPEVNQAPAGPRIHETNIGPAFDLGVGW